MSNALLNAAWMVRGLKQSERNLLIYMCDIAREPDREFFVNDENVANVLEMSVRNLGKARKKLISMGQISVKKGKLRTTKFGVRHVLAVHPTPSATPELSDTDTGKKERGQENKTTPTPELSDTPIRTIKNQSYPKEPEQGNARPLRDVDDWKLGRDLSEAENRIDREKEKSPINQDILNYWRDRRKKINNELENRGKLALRNKDADRSASRGRNEGTANVDTAGEYSNFKKRPVAHV